METLLVLVLLLAASAAGRGLFPSTEAERARRDESDARKRREEAERSEKRQEQASKMPPAWPVAVPADLPQFPAGWEYATPTPIAVRTRAYQLLQPLWTRGKGSTAQEMTGGEWITYRAEITAGNKHGVVAYRVRKGQLPMPKPAAPATAALPPIDARSPGLPQPQRTAPAIPTAMPLPMPLPSPSPAPATNSPGSRPMLRQGSGMGALTSHATWVKELQLRLRLMPVDGKFGANTREAVMVFQRKHPPLKPDGIVGPNTWAALDRAWEVSVGPGLMLPSPAPA